MPTFLIDGEEWMTIDLAAQILTAQNSREVTPSSIRKMASDGRLKIKKIDARTNLYNANQIRAYRLRSYKKAPGEFTT